MRSFGKTISAVAGLSLLGMASANIAHAEAVTFSFNGGCAVDCGTDGPNGNTRTFTGSDGTTTVSVQAWGLTKGSSNYAFESAFVGHYSNGLGVTNRDESGSGSTHTNDNNSQREVLAFFFSDTVEFTAAYLSAYSDTDMSVWIGVAASMPDLTDTSLNTFGELDTAYGAHFDNDGGTSSRLADFGTDSEFGNLLLISARIDHTNDKFKLKTLYVTTSDTPPGDVPGVAEPGTMLMFALGLAGLGYARRRKAAKAA